MGLALFLYNHDTDDYELARNVRTMTLDVDSWSVEDDRLVHHTGFWLRPSLHTVSDTRSATICYDCSIGHEPPFTIRLMENCFDDLLNALRYKECRETVDKVRVLAKLSA